MVLIKNMFQRTIYPSSIHVSELYLRSYPCIRTLSKIVSESRLVSELHTILMCTHVYLLHARPYLRTLLYYQNSTATVPRNRHSVDEFSWPFFYWLFLDPEHPASETVMIRIVAFYRSAICEISFHINKLM